MACMTRTLFPRSGTYAGNAAGISLCLKDQDCATCTATGDCPGDRVCVDLGASGASDYRCVPSCTDNASCSGQAATTCSDGTDPDGKAVKGCFEMQNSQPVNYCASTGG